MVLAQVQDELASRNLEVFGGVLLELVFPVDLETKPANVEFLGFLHAEDAQNWDRASELDRHGVTLSLDCQSDQRGRFSPRPLQLSMAEDDDALGLDASVAREAGFRSPRTEALLELNPSAGARFWQGGPSVAFLIISPTAPWRKRRRKFFALPHLGSPTRLR